MTALVMVHAYVRFVPSTDKDMCAVLQIICEGVTEKSLKSTLMGRTVKRVGRKGKQMWIEFEAGDTRATQEPVSLLLHLGMTGAVVIHGKKGIK